MDRNAIKACPCCRRGDVLIEAPSFLDLSYFMCCPTCFDHRAHPLQHVLNVEREIGWSSIPKSVRSTITVWQGHQYISMVEWAKNAIHQQVVVYQGKSLPIETRMEAEQRKRDEAIEAIEEAETIRILKKQKEVIEQCPRFFRQPKTPRTLWQRISTW